MRSIGLCETRITSAGLADQEPHLGPHTLTVGDTKVDDAGLKHLLKLAGLKYLYIAATPITPEGVAALRAERPALRIITTSPRTLAPRPVTAPK